MTNSAPRIAATALVAALLTVVAGCSARQDREQSDATTSVTTSAPVSPSSSASSPSNSLKRTELSCADQLTPTTRAGGAMPHVLGLASDGWLGSRTIRGLGDRTRRTYLGFKTYTYVTLAAAPRTTIRVVTPRDAVLFYASGFTWTSGLTRADAIAGATKSVTLHGCGSNLTGYGGELLLKRSGCVTLEFRGRVAGTPTHQRLTFPMGKPC